MMRGRRSFTWVLLLLILALFCLGSVLSTLSPQDSRFDHVNLAGWGSNVYGQLANGKRSQLGSPGLALKPTKWYAGDSEFTNAQFQSISCSNRHCLAIGSDSKLYGWGANDRGQLGLGINIKAPLTIITPLIGLQASLGSNLVSCVEVAASNAWSFCMDSENRVWRPNYAAEGPNSHSWNEFVANVRFYSMACAPTYCAFVSDTYRISDSEEQVLVYFVGSSLPSPTSPVWIPSTYQYSNMSASSSHLIFSRSGTSEFFAVGELSGIAGVLVDPQPADTGASKLALYPYKSLIACGNRSYILAENGTLATTQGTLKVTQAILAFNSLSIPISEISCAGEVLFVLAVNGSIFSFGDQSSALLGRADPTEVSPIRGLTYRSTRLMRPFDGSTMFALLDSSSPSGDPVSKHRFAGYGLNQEGSALLGFTSLAELPTVGLDINFDYKTIKKLISGRRWTAYILEDGSVWATRRPLGGSWPVDQDSSLYPVPLEFPTGLNPSETAAMPYSLIYISRGVQDQLCFLNFKPDISDENAPTTSGNCYALYDGTRSLLACGINECYVINANNTVTRFVTSGRLQTLDNVLPDNPTYLSAGHLMFVVANTTTVTTAWIGGNPHPISPIPPFETVAALSTGLDSVYMLTSSGKIYSWGSNTLMQLGRNSTANWLDVGPILSPAGLTFRQVGSSSYTGFGLSTEGAVYTWGMAAFQGGIGDTSDRHIPTPIAFVDPSTTASLSIVRLFDLCITHTPLFITGPALSSLQAPAISTGGSSLLRVGFGSNSDGQHGNALLSNSVHASFVEVPSSDDLTYTQSRFDPFPIPAIGISKFVGAMIYSSTASSSMSQDLVWTIDTDGTAGRHSLNLTNTGEQDELLSNYPGHAEGYFPAGAPRARSRAFDVVGLGSGPSLVATRSIERHTEIYTNNNQTEPWFNATVALSFSGIDMAASTADGNWWIGSSLYNRWSSQSASPISASQLLIDTDYVMRGFMLQNESTGLFQVHLDGEAGLLCSLADVRLAAVGGRELGPSFRVIAWNAQKKLMTCGVSNTHGILGYAGAALSGWSETSHGVIEDLIQLATMEWTNYFLTRSGTVYVFGLNGDLGRFGFPSPIVDTYESNALIMIPWTKASSTSPSHPFYPRQVLRIVPSPVTNSTYFIVGVPLPSTIPTPPSVVSVPCAGSQPSPSFVCNPDTGVWYSNFSVSVPTGSQITITGPTVINGSVVVAPGATLVLTLPPVGTPLLSVNGCVVLDGELTIELTAEDIKALENEARGRLLTLISAQCGNVEALDTANVVQPKGCKRVDVSRQQPGGSSAVEYTALFKINSSKCNLWWIILVAVLGGVVLIAIIIALVFTLTPLKGVIRPYIKRNAPTTSE